MKSYIQKSGNNSHTLEVPLRASQQPNIEKILQIWHSKKKCNPITIASTQHRQYDVLQREVDPNVLESLEKPVFQSKGTTICWFLSILYGLHQAGWVRDLFENNIITVIKRETTYECSEGDRTINVQFIDDERPLWQQILEAFINNDIDTRSIPPTLLKSGDESSLERIKGLGGMGGIPRDDLKLAVQALLNAIYEGLTVEENVSKSPLTITGENSPFKEMIGRTYLSPLPKGDREILEVMTVEKKGHAMGVVPQGLTFGEKKLPSVQVSRSRSRLKQPPQKGVIISGLKVFNQSFSVANTQKYRDIDPTTGVDISAVKEIGQTKVPRWAQSLNYINYYKLNRPAPRREHSSSPTTFPMAEPQLVIIPETITDAKESAAPGGEKH